MEDYSKLFVKTTRESEKLDYKGKINFSNNKLDFFIDINAFANNDTIESQYIIYGVKEEKVGEFNFVGLSDYPTIKEEDIQKWIYDNIQPKIKISLIKYSHKNKNFLILQIDADKSQRPYIFKKEYNYKNDKRKIYQGDGWIRIGASTRRLNREDLEEIYGTRKVKMPIDVTLYDNELYITDIDPCNLLMTITNPSAINQIFTNVYLDISDEKDNILTSIKMIHFLEINEEKGNITTSRSRKIKEDLENISENFLSIFTLNIPKEKSLIGVGVFAFSSSDAIRVKLDQYGESDIKYTFKLYFKNEKNEIQDFKYKNCSIFAKGKVLWKIENTYKKRR